MAPPLLTPSSRTTQSDALDLIDYKTHARVDAALAALTAATPRLMGFANDDEARLFRVHALARTVVSSLTDFDE